MSIPQAFIQELVARADVVEVVGRYVPLKKSGANFSGLCPFHAEKSPSFTVSPTKQFYHCFGCGKNGNAIGFLMDHAGMGFVEAVHQLAGEYGMTVPEPDQTPQDRAAAAQRRQQQATLADVLDKAAQAYRRQLRDSPRAVEYLRQRGLTGEIARRFGLGYAPAGWRSLASVFPRYDDPLLVESGLVIESGEEDGEERKRYDRFRDRIMFPIRDVKGVCIGFGGRVLGDEKPKYLNSPETPLFSKGRELYGLFEARTALREHGHVLVTEGYMDVVALAQLGFPNAVATLGTACTSEHVHKLFRFTDSVVFSFDGDAAGRRAARKALEVALPHASDMRSVRFLFLPPEHDPDSYVRTHGSDAFARCVREAMPLSRFLVESAAEGCDLGSTEGRARLASQARALWTQLPDGALARQLLAELAAMVQLTPRELAELWRVESPRGGPAVRPRAGPVAADQRQPGRHMAEASGARGGAIGSGRRSVARQAPASRADHAVRSLLGHMALWPELSDEQHALLCSLPEPHGALCIWLEAAFHDHGPLAWGALREGLRDHALEAFALRLMDGAMAGVEGEAQDARDELRHVLTRLQIDQVKAQETAAIEAAASDPQALAQYRELQRRRRELEANLAPKPA